MQPIGRHRSQRTRMAVRADGRQAVTHYRIVRALPRAHAGARAARDRAHAPDPRAPGAHRASRSSAIRSTAAAAACRQAARAALQRGAAASFRARRCTRRACSCEHPLTGASCAGEAPLPEDMQQLLAALRGAHGREQRADAGGRRPSRGRTGRRRPRRARRLHAARRRRQRGPYDSLNLGAHVGDAPRGGGARTAARVRRQLQLPHEPLWLEQVHGSEVVDADAGGGGGAARRRARMPPSRVSAGAVLRGAGGRLPAGAVRRARRQRGRRRRMPAGAAWPPGCSRPRSRALVCRPRAAASPGSALRSAPAHFEVGEEVRAAFLAHDRAAAPRPSRANARGRWQCDLRRSRGAAAQRSASRRVMAASGAPTREPQRFFSYRRDGDYGRMAALIWLR